MQPNADLLSSMAPDLAEENRLAEELTETSGDTIKISGDRRALDRMMGKALPDASIGYLFGGIKGSLLEIEPDGSNVDIWTLNDWFETPLYFSVEKDGSGITQTINDLFLKESAPKTLGTRMVAHMIFEAARIPRFDSIRASATRFYFPIDGGSIREVNGYYFFPRLGFNADPKNADDYLEIPRALKGKKLLSIMRDAQRRQWWKENGQTIEVRFKIRSKRSILALQTYLLERGINISNAA